MALCLFINIIGMRCASNDQRRSKGNRIDNPIQRKLEQRTFAQQRQERLRQFVPTARPQPRAAASAEYNRLDQTLLFMRVYHNGNHRRAKVSSQLKKRCR